MMPEVVNILKAEIDGDYRLHLAFDDGKQQTIDFYPFLARAVHPDIRAYLDPGRFSEFAIQNGELVWGDYELCFPMADLYHNRILGYLPVEQVA